MSYKGRTYVCKYVGPTAYGRRAKLAFTDGSKEFWCDAADLSPVKAPKVPAVKAAPVTQARIAAEAEDAAVGPADTFDEFTPGEAHDLEAADQDEPGDAFEPTADASPAPAAKRPARILNWLFKPSPATRMVGVLRLTVDGAEVTYAVREDHAPANLGGRLWRLTKPDGTIYSVLVGLNGQDHSCDCRGHRSRGKCKHVDAMTASLKRGEIK